AWATIRRNASSRARSQTFSYSEMLPPKIDFNPPVTPATTLVARTTRPRTTPLYSVIRWPETSFEVVTINVIVHCQRRQRPWSCAAQAQRLEADRDLLLQVEQLAAQAVAFARIGRGVDQYPESRRALEQ